jgi:hypothetical protein
LWICAGEAERVEVVAGRLDLAAVDDLVAEPEEDVLDVAARLRGRVKRAAPARLHGAEHLGGQRHVGALGRELVVQFGLADRGATRLERLLNLLADRVEPHAGLAVADLAQLQLQRAVPAEPVDGGLLDLVGRLRPVERGGRVAHIGVWIPIHGGDCIRVVVHRFLLSRARAVGLTPRLELAEEPATAGAPAPRPRAGAA